MSLTQSSTSYLDAADQVASTVVAQIVRLAHQDEARHVAFGVAHLRRHVGRDARLRERLEGLGFGEAEAADLSALHTRNFM